jgi:hypothetical protein
MMMNVDDDNTGSRLIDRSRQNNHAATSTLPPVFNTSEACHYLRISRPTFLKLIATARFERRSSARDGKCWTLNSSASF